jgi:hypothetical protein
MYRITSNKLRLLRDSLWNTLALEAGPRPDDTVTWTLYDEQRERIATATWAELQTATVNCLHWRTSHMQAALPGG